MGLLEPHGRGGRPFRRAALNKASAVFVVHSFAHAVAALEAAVAADRAIVLLSAPGAGIHAGPGWWRALAEAAREAVPGAAFTTVLDCGDDAGAAQGAIRAGISAIVFTGRGDVTKRLAAIAEQSGAQVLTARPEPALDLVSFFFSDAETLRQTCRDYLASLPAIC